MLFCYPLWFHSYTKSNGMSVNDRTGQVSVQINLNSSVLKNSTEIQNCILLKLKPKTCAKDNINSQSKTIFKIFMENFELSGEVA